jgi:hypothetical protein
MGPSGIGSLFPRVECNYSILIISHLEIVSIRCRCADGYELRAGLCYKKCDPGWYDDGGVACTRNDCNANEEDNGAGWCNARCAPGYRAAATMCINDWCPDGYRNDPLSCWCVAASC